MGPTPLLSDFLFFMTLFGGISNDFGRSKKKNVKKKTSVMCGPYSTQDLTDMKLYVRCAIAETLTAIRCKESVMLTMAYVMLTMAYGNRTDSF